LFEVSVGYLKKVREICDKHAILFIADEVMSGFGRTGKWFGVDNHGIVPDMIATAKGITSGYLPLGALIVSEKIAKQYDDNVLWLGLTYSAHPVSLSGKFRSIENL
jgi:taurine--2-oxoglutarate transaminase